MKRIHSISLSITNSSTTTFIILQSDALQSAKELCEKMHKAFKLPNTWQDYFKVKLTCDISILKYYIDVFEKIDERYSDVEKIQEYMENEPDKFFEAVGRTAANIDDIDYCHVMDSFKIEINIIGTDIDLANLDLYCFESACD